MSKNMTDKSQLERFKEAARQLEVDEDEVVFDEKLKALTKRKPPPEFQKMDEK